MPTGDAFNEAEHLNALLDLFRSGVDTGGVSVRLVETSRKSGLSLHNVDRYESDDNFARVVERAKCIETKAKAEIDSGYSSIYSLAVVRLWTILENAVSRLAKLRLGDNSVLGSSPVLRRLNGPIVDILLSTPEERIDMIYEELASHLKVRLKPGVGRFEALLESVGLSGGVDDEIRKELVELWAVRNVIVHSSGRFDQRFLYACPWYPAARNEIVTVSSSRFNVYLSAVLWYMKISADYPAACRGAEGGRGGRGGNWQVHPFLKGPVLDVV